MTNTEILEKAITMAIENGWHTSLQVCEGGCIRHEDGEVWEADGFKPDVFEYPELVIFNHDFVKALWGELLYTRPAFEELEPPRDVHPWKYHLIHMVIADNPIKYLGRHLDD